MIAKCPLAILMVAVQLTTTSAPSWGATDTRPRSKVLSQCDVFFSKYIEITHAGRVRTLWKVLNLEFSRWDGIRFGGPKELEPVYEAFLHDSLFRHYLGESMFPPGGRPWNEAELVDAHRTYVAEKPRVFTTSYWREFHLVRNFSHRAQQYVFDVAHDPWHLVYLPHNSKVPWDALPMHLMNHAWAWTTGSRSRFAFVPANMIFMGFLLLLHELFTDDPLTLEQIAEIERMLERFAGIDLKMRLDSASVSIVELKETILQRAGVLQDFQSFMDSVDFSRPDAKHTITAYLSRSRLWSPFIHLKQFGFFKSLNDYDELSSVYADLYLRLATAEREYAATGRTDADKSRRMEQSFVAHAAFYETISGKYLEKYGHGGFLILSGMKYGIPSEELYPLYKLTQSQDPVTKEQINRVLMADNPWQEFHEVKALSDVRASRLSERSIADLDRLSTMERWNIINTEQKRSIARLLKNAYDAPTNQGFIDAVGQLNKFLIESTDVPTNLHNYVLNAGIPLQNLDRAVRFYDSSSGSPLDLLTTDDLRMLGVTRFEFSLFAQDEDFGRSRDRYGRMETEIKRLNTIRQAFAAKPPPSPEEALAFARNHGLFETVRNKNFSDQVTGALIAKAVAMQMYFYEAHELNGWDVSDWKTAFAEKTQVTGRLIEQLQGKGPTVTPSAAPR